MKRHSASISLLTGAFSRNASAFVFLRHVKDVVRCWERNTGAPQMERREARGGLSCILVPIPKLFEWDWRCSLWARHQFSHPTFIRTTGNINITEFFHFFPSSWGCNKKFVYVGASWLPTSVIAVICQHERQPLIVSAVQPVRDLSGIHAK